MANKKENKKAKKAKAISKPAKKVVKSATKKSSKSPAKPVAKKAAKPAPKKVAKSAPKSTVKKATKPTAKKVVKPIAKASVKSKTPAVKKAVEKAKSKPEVKKSAGKPIDAIAKKEKNTKASKKGGKSKSSKSSDDDDEEVEEKEDSYEKPDEDDAAIDGELDEAGLVDLEGASPSEPDEDDDEVPEKRGRGRRKKNEGRSSGSGMEAYIRNRPLQIDITKPLIKKGNAAEQKPFVNTEDNRTRYSDKELTEFKELILEKLKEAQEDYDLLKQTLSNEDNHGTDDTSPSFKLLEDGSDVMSKEETAQLASRQEKYIVNLKNALVRIENKSYGICRVTGKLIPKERLRVVPHATLGIDAKLGQNN